MYWSTVAEASGSWSIASKKQSRAKLPNTPRATSSPRRWPHGETPARRRPTAVRTMLIRARHSTISATGSRLFSCLTQTVIRLKARELRIRARLPRTESLFHQGCGVCGSAMVVLMTWCTEPCDFAEWTDGERPPAPKNDRGR